MTLAIRTFESTEHGEAQEAIACPLCDQPEGKGELVLWARDLLFDRPGRYKLQRCTACQLEYVNPRPTGTALGAHYPDNYFGYNLHDDDPAVLRPFLRAFADGISRLRVRYLESAMGRVKPDDAILDIGCGTNRLLSFIKAQRGCVGTGLDFKPEIVQYVRDTLRMPVVEGTLHSAGFDDGKFDLLLMMEYLEHEPDPLSILREARRVTRTGGHLALELPHLGFPARLFRSFWWNLDIPRHLVFFTPKTLGAMLERAGYELVSVKRFTFPLYIGLSVVQALGLRHWSKHRAFYPLLSTLISLPLLPLMPLLPEFMFAVARAK